MRIVDTSKRYNVTIAEVFMSSKQYSEEFKIEAVKQITERNYPVGQVSRRLGVTTKSLYICNKRTGKARYF